MERVRRRAMALINAMALLVAAAAAAPAQDPVIKPRTTGQRLGAPAGITAVQQADGRIRVVWGAVGGAEEYVLTRSVPNLGNRPLSLPNSTDTVYVDSDVREGHYYYYTVNAVDASGAGGLKAAAPPVRSTRTVTPAQSGTVTSVAPPVDTRAVLSPNNADVTLHWRVTQPDIISVVESNRVPSSGRATGWVARYRSPPVPARLLDSTGSRAMALPDRVSPGDRVIYRVRNVSTIDPSVESSPVVSNELVIPSTVTPPTSSGAVAATGSTTFLVAPALTIAAGATTSLAAMGGTGTRWVSMNDGVATVDANGTVAGHAGGTTSVVALRAEPDGSLRVTTVRVTVNP